MVDTKLRHWHKGRKGQALVGALYVIVKFSQNFIWCSCGHTLFTVINLLALQHFIIMECGFRNFAVGVKSEIYWWDIKLLIIISAICQLKNLEIHTVLSKDWQLQTNTEEEYYNLDFPKIPWFSLPHIWCWFPICWLEIVTTDMVAIHQLRIPAAWSGAARNNYLLSAQQQPGWSGPSAATLYIIEL